MQGMTYQQRFGAWQHSFQLSFQRLDRLKLLRLCIGLWLHGLWPSIEDQLSAFRRFHIWLHRRLFYPWEKREKSRWRQQPNNGLTVMQGSPKKTSTKYHSHQHQKARNTRFWPKIRYLGCDRDKAQIAWPPRWSNVFLFEKSRSPRLSRSLRPHPKYTGNTTRVTNQDG